MLDMRQEKQKLLRVIPQTSDAEVRASLIAAAIAAAVGIGMSTFLWKRDNAARANHTGALPEQGEWFRSILGSIGDAVIAAGPDGKIRFINRSAEELTGWSEKEAAGLSLDTVFRTIDERSRRKAEDPVTKVLSAGRTAAPPDHTVLISRSGAERRIDDYSAPIRDADGNIIGVAVVFRELTREERAGKVDRLLASIVESSDDAIYAKTLDGTILSWNGGAERIYGYTPAEAIGKNVSMLVPPDMADEVPEILRQIRRGERIAHYETVRLRKDGSRVHVSVSLSPLTDEDGKITGASSLARDITERKTAEEMLRRTADELDRSNKELEQFAYIASHDMQEPLRTITGYLQLLRSRYKEQIDEKADRYIDYAVDGAERMSSLIRDLLDYSRVNTRGEEMRPTNAEESLEFALRNLKSAIDQCGASVTHDQLPVVKADRTQLGRLFQNLIGNAIKYRSPERNPRIHISARRNNGDFVFDVEDNGIGFEQQYATKVFQIFQRLHSRGRYPGTGIGLAICKRIVDRHGGRIWAVGDPGRGAKFSFTIPIQGRT